MNKPWRTFCRPGTNFAEHYECRGTSLIGAANLSPVTKLIAGTCAVSRYKFDRSREFIPGYKFDDGHWRSVAIQIVSKPVTYHGAGVKLRAGVRVRVHEPLRICLGCRSKAKTVTNNLPILSVLAVFLFSNISVIVVIVSKIHTDLVIYWKEFF